MEQKNDGIYGMLDETKMAPEALILRKTYNITKDAPIIQKEFGFLFLENWYKEGLPRNKDINELFGFDASGYTELWGLGWDEGGFDPWFDVKVLEDRGEYELEQDFAGRKVLYFKGKRNGFMPTFVDHPVKDEKTWEENIAWRMDPKSPNRQKQMDSYMPGLIQEAKKGKLMTQRLVGGYMYLRSLIGPEEVLYMFYDNPKLIHTCMEAWFNLADSIIERHQKFVTLDELSLGEDISFKNGMLISPKMFKEFLNPYYEQLLMNIKKRQLDKNRHLYFYLDTDGNLDQVIPLYRSLGMDVLTPLEIAAGTDVLKIAEEHPDMVLIGGIDKRVLAEGKDAIDRYLDKLMPKMKKRGGFIPTSDHFIPEEVSLENYLHYRKRMLEYAK